ncbi:MAG: hypothetical protein IKB71_07510 [Lentisphaeria bacterium]|nr:hypothetical protein [Lentisphaeria bacterium]
MIIYGIFRLLHWLYGWGEITIETRKTMTGLSGAEMGIISLVLIVSFFVELPDMIENWRKK